MPSTSRARGPVVAGVVAGVRRDPPPRRRPRRAGRGRRGRCGSSPSRRARSASSSDTPTRSTSPHWRGRWCSPARRVGSAAGAAAAVATASRPNGWIAAVAVIIVIARTDRSWRAVARAVAHRRPCSCSGGSGTSTTRPAIRSCSGRPSRRGTRRRSSSGLADLWSNHLELFHIAWFAVALVFYVRRVVAPASGVARHHRAHGGTGAAVRRRRARPLRSARLPHADRRRRLVRRAEHRTGRSGRALGCSAIGLGYFAHAVVADSWLP